MFIGKLVTDGNMERGNHMKRKLHNLVLEVITTISLIVMLLSLISLDSDSWIPIIAMVLSMGWLALFLYANTHEERKNEDEVESFKDYFGKL